jgi:integrase
VATITKRGESSWRVQIRRADLARPIWKTFHKEAEAERWALIMEGRAVAGEIVDLGDQKRVKLSDLLESYCEFIKQRDLLKQFNDENSLRKQRGLPPVALDDIESSRSVKNSIAHARAIASHWLGSLPALEVTTAQIQTLVKDLQKHVVVQEKLDKKGQVIRPAKVGYDPETINQRLNVLHHAYEMAGKLDRPLTVSKNPVEKVERPAKPKGRDRRLFVGEEARLRKECRAVSPAWEAVVIVAIESAMRQSELLTLTWSQIDYRRGTAQLDKTKNGDTRTVPLTDIALEAIGKIKPEGELDPDGLVFGIGNRSAFKTAFGRLMGKKQFLGLRFHDLRHEAASRLFEDTDLRDIEIAQVTGHKSMAMLKRYSHLRAESLRDRMNRKRA